MKLRTLSHKLTPSKRAKVRVEKRADAFYSTPAWRALVARLIKQRGRRCEDPEHDCSTPRFGVRIFGDHIIEKRDGGAPLDPRNILLRCGSCHTRKTAAERAQRYGLRGVDRNLLSAKGPSPHASHAEILCPGLKKEAQ